MITHDHDKISDVYDKACKREKEPWKAVFWSSKISQEVHFLILLMLTNWNGDTLLDVGCGLGDLYGFFKQKNLNIVYEGIDISEEMVKKAKKRYPDGVFEKDNFLNDHIDRQYDYVLCSGALNLPYKEYDLYLEESVKKLFSLAKKGLGFNLLSLNKKNLNGKRNNGQSKEELGLVYNDPVKVFQFCLNLTPHVSIRHDYGFNDFTVFMYKR